MPITTAPSIWLRPASGLRIRPASITETTRLTRKRAISGCHVTSTKWQPKECVENFGLGLPNVVSLLPLPEASRMLARRRTSAKGTPSAPPRSSPTAITPAPTASPPLPSPSEPSASGPASSAPTRSSGSASPSPSSSCCAARRARSTTDSWTP